MKVKGFVTIIKSVDGVVTQKIEQENLILANFYILALGFLVNQNFGAATKIFTSTNTDPPNFNLGRFDTLPGMVEGTTPIGVTSPVYIDSVTPHFAQYQTQFSPPPATNTFQTVGLIVGGSIIAYLLLDTPCIQETNEFLDIFYRVQFTNIGNSLNDHVIDNFGRGLTVGIPYLEWTNVAYYFGNLSVKNLSKYTKPYVPNANLIDGNPNSSGAANYWTSGTIVESHFKHKQLAAFTEIQQVGKIINQLLYGYNSIERYAYHLDKTDNSTPIQSFFGHSSTADKPFFDSLNLASGKGTIALAGIWTGNYPELHKISITKSGVTGVSEYRWNTRKWLGFNGNTYEDLLMSCPYLNVNTPAAINIHGWREEDFDKLKYSDTQIVQYDQTGVTLLDIINGDYKTWNATSTPSLPVIQLRQCAVDTTNKKIYCACRSTGLWVIDTIANTISHPITTPCYGVDVGRNNIVFAISTGGIYKSNDFTTPLIINISDLVTVQFLKVDPEHIDDRIAIVVNLSGNNYQVKWWEGLTQATIDGATTNIKAFPSSLEVSDTDSFWMVNQYKLEFGNTNTTLIQTPYNQKSLDHSVYGIQTYYKIDFYKQFFIGYDGLYKQDGTLEVGYQILLSGTSVTPYSLHLKDGIILTQVGLKQLFTNNQYCWTNYGWNGLSWVEGNITSKVTHTTPQALGNGITIAFQDAPTAPHWVNTDYYTFAAANGLVKDNATTFYVDMSWYSAPALTNQPYTVIIPSELEIILPGAADPGFITLEVDSPLVHIFKIDNVLVAFVRTDNTEPAPNEVTIYADGKVKFNASDTGKTFTASYTYVKI